MKKEFSIGLAVFAACLLILISGSWFLTAKIAASSNALKIKKSEIETVYARWQDLAQSQAELQKMQGDLEKINGVFVPPETPYDFINSLEELAKLSGLNYEINLVTLGPQDREKTMTFQIEFAGSFNNLMHFLRYLENMRYYAQIEALQISEAKKTGPEVKTDVPGGGISGLITLKAFIEI